MRRQEFRREHLRESGHVAEGGVDLEGVHASEIGGDISQSVYLDTGVKLLVEQDRHTLGTSLIKFEFVANVDVLEENCVHQRQNRQM